MSRLAWAELREQAPELCEAVIAWAARAHQWATVAPLLRGETPASNPKIRAVEANRLMWAIQGVRLKAAEYRMEATAIQARQALSTAWMETGRIGKEAGHRTCSVLAAEGGWRHDLADALDAAADEAHRLAGCSHPAHQDPRAGDRGFCPSCGQMLDFDLAALAGHRVF